jgi:predicted RNA-binding Zn ribbon-like protein
MRVEWADQRVAPGRLELIRAFVNTIDLARGGDVLAQPTGVREWLVGQGLATGDLVVDVAGSRRALQLREALRSLLLANGGCPAEPQAIAAVNDVVARASLAPRLADDGRAQLTVAKSGLDGALGLLVAPMFDAIADGNWQRLRACQACQWAFYDSSRNRSSRWCDMAICGNRAKQRAFSERRKRPSS